MILHFVEPRFRKYLDWMVRYLDDVYDLTTLWPDACDRYWYDCPEDLTRWLEHCRGVWVCGWCGLTILTEDNVIHSACCPSDISEIRGRDDAWCKIISDIRAMGIEEITMYSEKQSVIRSALRRGFRRTESPDTFKMRIE